MATCASCGAASPDGFRFCGTCGTRLAEEAVRLAGQTDSHELRGQAQRALADVEDRRSGPARARAARERALRSLERKGNSVPATRILEQRGDQDDGDVPDQPTSARVESRP